MYRNQSTDLLWKSMVRFLYDRDLRVRVRVGLGLGLGSVVKESWRSSPIMHQKSVLTCCKAEFTFFPSGFSFHEYPRFMGQQVKGKDIIYLQISFLPLSPTSQSSPPRVADSRTRSKNFWYTMFRIHSFYTCTGSSYC